MSRPSTPLAKTSEMLEGTVVLDFTRVLAGPHCTRLLADLGARVIKIERPGEGDEMRRAPAKLPGDGDHSTYFARRNAGKESVAVDLSTPSGQAVIHDLVRHADVAIENFVPGVLDRLNCGYDKLRSIKPDLVFCSVSGYGQTGPMANRGAFAHVISAASGVMHLDATSGAPRSSHLQAADVMAGTNAFGTILAALLRRNRTGQGARVDVSMLESLMAGEDISFGNVPNGVDALSGPRGGMGISPVGNRYVAWQSGGAPMLWPRLTDAMGRPELRDDPQFATPEARRDHWPELHDAVSEWLSGFSDAAAALDAFSEARIPAALVQTPTEVVNHPQIKARKAFTPIEHPGGGEVFVSSSPYWIDDGPVTPTGPAPFAIGEHTWSVLSQLLAYSDEQIESLAADGAIALPD